MIKRTPNIAAVYNFQDISSALNLAGDPKVIDKFAGSLTVFLQAQYIYPVNSGVSAFYLILESLKHDSLKKEVILPAYTAGSLVVAIKKAGLKPALCDISLEDFNLDTKVLSKSVSDDTLAAVAVHMFGIGIGSISQIKMTLPTGVTLIEDCAQAFGSRIRARPVGSFSDISFFSFNRGKNFPLYSGGCILVNSPDLSGKIESLCKQLPENTGAGIFAKIAAFYFATRPYVYGLAYQAISCFRDTVAPKDFKVCRISRIQAGLGIRCLEKIDIFLKARYEKGKFLIKSLKSETGLILPIISEDDYPVFNQVPVLFKDSTKLGIIEKKLMHSGLEASRVYKRPLHHMFELGYKPEDFPNANYLADHLLALPIHHLVSEQDIEKMIDIIKKNI
ncbi:MAG: DegT/DnrJ/EryC1/StrS family aminotransferase [Candidatus Omnitrophota bacterium]|nr:DegT/DnrJ/EryC1/StrS family aminotransferase [Candidatus Omnitrophota bacterium]MBU1928494.1 DegT/DnrJ/EryC1/StrS family aminotransferase [Candidatus Omnitrophota bacterium]MBU2257948.1 DegT/DnrJ/EryC1/StrS family aminotransferase [Candidatus Omnitrophota bacterium]